MMKGIPLKFRVRCPEWWLYFLFLVVIAVLVSPVLLLMILIRAGKWLLEFIDDRLGRFDRWFTARLNDSRFCEWADSRVSTKWTNSKWGHSLDDTN